MTPATLDATLSWRSNTFSSEPSKRSAQRCVPVSASISCAVIRTRPAALRTEPSRTLARAQFAADPLHLDGLTFVGKARIAGDDEQPANAAQGRDDFLDHAVGKIFLLRVAGHVGERQYRDRRLVPQC